MKLELDDTIAALASAPGRAERGIVRVSGPDVRLVLERVLSEREEVGGRARPLCLENIRRAWRVSASFQQKEGTVGLPVDVFWWPTKRSYTGQPMAELHTVGSPPLLELLLQQLFRNGARPARPGEFTLRAFLSGRIDLVQAEAVVGVVDARTQQELQLALQQLAGTVSSRIGEVRQQLVELLADLEAGLDFADEDIEFVDEQTLVRRLEKCRAELSELLDEASERMHSTVRRRVVLAGLPNAGKSSLFNTLLGRPAALVSTVEGTTRDYLVEPFEVQGIEVELVDTAGWQTELDELMKTALQLGRQQVQQADLVVWCSALDLKDPRQREQDEACWRQVQRSGVAAVRVWTKADLVERDKEGSSESFQWKPNAEEWPAVSSVTGEGVKQLLERLAVELSGADVGERRMLGSTAARCRRSLEAATESLTRALEAACAGLGEELVALELRQALDELGAILGEVYTEDILDRIFSKFCIGK